MGRYVAEIRPAGVVARLAFAIVADREKMAPVLAPTRDRHSARLRINAVFDRLGDRLQWAGLRQGDDSDGVPVVADLQLAARPARVLCLSVFCALLIIMDGSDERRPKPRETGNFGAAETACGVGAGVAPRSLCRLP